LYKYNENLFIFLTNSKVGNAMATITYVENSTPVCFHSSLVIFSLNIKINEQIILNIST